MSRQHQDVATTSGCRDNIRMSRQKLYREDVTTTPGCHDNNCFHDMSQQHRGSYDKNCDKNGDRNRCRDKRLMSRQHQYTGPVHSSPKECIGIRAQLRNPINKQLPRRKRQAVGEAEKKIWVAEGLISFFFFSFLFLYFRFLFPSL